MAQALARGLLEMADFDHALHTSLRI